MKIKCDMGMKPGVVNSNGRMYPKEIFERELKKYQKLINEGRALIEYNVNGTMVTNSVINLSNVAAEVTHIDSKDGCYTVEVDILDTPSGVAFKDLFKDDTPESISSNYVFSPVGQGEVDENGVIQDNYTLTQFAIIPKKESSYYKED